MKKKTHTTYKWKHIHHQKHPIRWLPVHHHYYPSFLKFGEVKGLSRVFLELEISLSLLIVSGTLCWAVLRIISGLLK